MVFPEGGPAMKAFSPAATELGGRGSMSGMDLTMDDDDDGGPESTDCEFVCELG